MKLSVIYDSVSGNTKQAAEYIVEGMSAEGAEAKAFPLTGVDYDFAKESAGLVFGTPTYLAGPTAAIYTWLEKESAKAEPAGKLGGAFATGGYIHGGEDLAIQRILTHLLVKGMMTHSGGGAHGAPVIHIGPVAIAPDIASYKDLFVTYGKRFAAQAKKIGGEV